MAWYGLGLSGYYIKTKEMDIYDIPILENMFMFMSAVVDIAKEEHKLEDFWRWCNNSHEHYFSHCSCPDYFF
jgi:hypothetical protein